MAESTSATLAPRKGQTPSEKLIMSDEARARIEPFLPKGVELDRVAAALELAVANDETGKLKECTKQSLVMGVARIMQWGLELGVTAYLLPFKGKAVPVADYKGLCELMVASKSVRHVEAHVVREQDKFEYRFGTDGFVRHQPLGGKREKRGAITHVWVLLHLPYGAHAFDVMTAEEVEEVRQNYSKQWKAGPLPEWYAKKTIIRRIAKTLPKSPQLVALFNVTRDDGLAEFDDPDERPMVLGATAKVSDDEHELDDRWIVEQENDAQSDETTGGGELPLGDRRARHTD